MSGHDDVKSWNFIYIGWASQLSSGFPFPLHLLMPPFRPISCCHLFPPTTLRFEYAARQRPVGHPKRCGRRAPRAQVNMLRTACRPQPLQSAAVAVHIELRQHAPPCVATRSCAERRPWTACCCTGVRATLQAPVLSRLCEQVGRPMGWHRSARAGGGRLCSWRPPRDVLRGRHPAG